MSMSTFVFGVRPPDDKWKGMKAVRDACIKVGTPVPEEVEKFFNYEKPDDKGILVEFTMDNKGKVSNGCCKPFYDENNCYEGFEIELSKVPKDITILRFVNGW